MQGGGLLWGISPCWARRSWEPKYEIDWEIGQRSKSCKDNESQVSDVGEGNRKYRKGEN